jgi:excisionase family DNA binding protein
MPRARPLNWERVPVSEAAHFLGVSTRTISRMVKDEILKDVTYTPGGHRRFGTSELRRLRRKQKRRKQAS